VIQTVQTGVQQFDNLFDAPADWNGTLYVHCEAEALQAFSWNNGQPSNQPVGSMRNILSAPRVPESRFRRTAPTTGLSGRSTIAMTIAAGLRFCAPTTPRMFSTELYDPTQAGSRDAAGLALKFTVPTIAGGKVFVGTSNELDIYGLLGK